MIRCLVLSLGFFGCGGDDATSIVTVDHLGQACDAAHPCSGGAICGTCGIGTGQCVAPCDASGFEGCPAGSFCSASWSDSSVHYCVLTCNNDSDCKPANAGLSCNDPYFDTGTHVDDVAICNVSNSIGSQNTCP